MSSLADAATWLTDVVGLNGVFTKAQLREAFPSVTQIDRRVRDLRQCGWVIHTRRQDPTLLSTQMRLVAIGSLERQRPPLDPTARRQALLRSAFTCVMCGGAAGHAYSDARHVRVQLVVKEWPESSGHMTPVCLRCSPLLESLPSPDWECPEAIAAATSLTDEEWRQACLVRLAKRVSQA